CGLAVNNRQCCADRGPCWQPSTRMNTDQQRSTAYGTGNPELFHRILFSAYNLGTCVFLRPQASPAKMGISTGPAAAAGLSLVFVTIARLAEVVYFGAA